MSAIRLYNYASGEWDEWEDVSASYSVEFAEAQVWEFTVFGESITLTVFGGLDDA